MIVVGDAAQPKRRGVGQVNTLTDQPVPSAPPRIIIDGSQFLDKSATGIGSYGRTLVRTLKSTDGQVGILYDRAATTRSNDPLLALAAQVFGNSPQKRMVERVLEDLPFLLRCLFGGGGISKAQNVPIGSFDMASFYPALPKADSAWNASRLSERSYIKFALSHRLTQVDLGNAFDLAHWLSPVAYKARSVPNIYTIHDMIPLRFPHFVIDRQAMQARLFAKIAHEADHIVTVSEASKRDIVELMGIPDDRVTVTYQPVPSLPPVDQTDAERLVQQIYGVKPGRYALFIGAIEPKKNIRRLIEAYTLAGMDDPLLLAGPLGWLYDDDLEAIDVIKRSTMGSSLEASFDGANFTGRIAPSLPLVRRLGFLPRSHIAALLKCAKFFVFPSICEGFGLPVLEAMQLGVPVLTSNVSSLAEVAGDAAVLVDPLDIGSMATAIRTMNADTDLRADLAQRGPRQAARFTVEGSRERLLQAYRKVGVLLKVPAEKAPQRL